jgi:hypothetical protein
MANKDEIYVSINEETYKQGKSNVLLGQADLLKTLKHLHNLKIISKQKADLKNHLHRLLSSTTKNMNQLKEALPTPTVPKSVKHEDEPEEKMTLSPSKRSAIDEELHFIQEKLRELNG